MLVLSRKLNQTVVIDGGIRVTVVAIHGAQVRLGIDAPAEVGIYREELLVRDQSAVAVESAAKANGRPLPFTGRHHEIISPS